MKGARGIGAMELILAGVLGALLVASGAFLFTTQVKGYRDIRSQARLQADAKKALRGMTRQISNTGACLPNPRQHFAPEASRLTFAYVDLRGRYCAPNATVIMSFRVGRGAADSLVQDIRCQGGSRQTRVLAEAPRNGLGLAFRYLDGNGAVTADPARIRGVELDLALEAGRERGQPTRRRSQTVRVQCVNL